MSSDFQEISWVITLVNYSFLELAFSTFKFFKLM